MSKEIKYFVAYKWNNGFGRCEVRSDSISNINDIKQIEDNIEKHHKDNLTWQPTDGNYIITNWQRFEE